MESDRDYYCRRAEEELHLAEESSETTAVYAHYQLANYYLDRAYGDAEIRPRLVQTVAEKTCSEAPVRPF